MKTFQVKWKEMRVINCTAEVKAETMQAAIKKAQAYDVDSDKGEWFEEHESYTQDIFPAKALEIEE